MMLPDDTNPMGNVHGGTILKLIEQAGHIVASRHCNSNRAIGPALTTVLARVEHMDFHNPMYVGEVAEIQAAVTFTSDHSMEVTVDVWAENVLKCSRKHTNSARLWYVAISAEVDHYEQTFKPLLVPQLIGLSEADFQAGRNRYEAQKKARFNASKTNPRNFEHSNLITTNSDEKTIAQSRSTLSVVVLPSDCSISRHMTGGALMKIMDTTAGICAVRHCRSLAVTACLDAINFHSPIFNGDMVFVTGELVFTSAKSVVVEIHVEAEGLNSGSRRVTNDALFTFVALGNDGRAVPVPQLKLKCEDEERKFEEMKKIYEIRKKERLQHK
jgi:acyl-coenzyme A thioesterase 7